MQKTNRHSDELLESFKTQVEEHLEQLNADLAALEKSSAMHRRPELYQRILREYHNIKGSAGIVGQTEVLNLVHELEDVLELMRQGRLNETREVFDLQYESLDAISLMIRCRLNGEELPDEVFQDLHKRIRQVKSGGVPEIKAVDASIRRPNEETGKRYFLRKGKRHE